VRADLIEAVPPRRFALARLLPPPGLPRAIAFQSALIAIGGGTYLTGSVVYFTHVLHLRPVQIGVGLSIAGFTSLVASLPLGGLADRLGGQRAWVIGALVEALAFAAFPLVVAFPAFVAVMMVIAAADSLAGAGRTVYTADAIPPEGRVRTMAFARSYLNVGFTVGAGLGAAALAVDSVPALNGMVLLNATVLLVNATVVARLPAAPRHHRERVKRAQLAVLRDTPYVVLAVLVAVLMFHGVIFTDIIPLWAITHTDVPKPTLGGLFALNTVMAVALQVPAARSADTLAGTVRLLRRAGLATALACPVAALAGLTRGGWTVAVLALAVALITVTELWLSVAIWFFQTNVPPAAQRGVYIGTSRMIGSAGAMVAPAGLTLLAIQTGGWGWWVVAAVFVGCAVVSAPVVGWVERTPRVGEWAPQVGEPPETDERHGIDEPPSANERPGIGAPPGHPDPDHALTAQ
jgi:MFS family permease